MKIAGDFWSFCGLSEIFDFVHKQEFVINVQIGLFDLKKIAILYMHVHMGYKTAWKKQVTRLFIWLDLIQLKVEESDRSHSIHPVNFIQINWDNGYLTNQHLWNFRKTIKCRYLAKEITTDTEQTMSFHLFWAHLIIISL